MHEAQPAPAHSGFWEQRSGWSKLKQFLLLEPLPGGARWTAAFGSLLLFAFLLQVVTGVLLAMNYAPSTEPVRDANQPVTKGEEVPTAWASVNYIQQEVPLGALVRGLHHWGSSAMIILLLVHLVQVFVWGAYKKPRELTWMVGVVLLVCVLGLAFTGYLLPWDQKAYWATKVGLGIASTTPVIGDSLRTLLQGGPEMGTLTLTRFFTLHGFVLPGLVVLLIVVHLYLFRLHGVTPTWGQSEAQLTARAEPFWPKQALMDGVMALIFLVVLGLWVAYQPAPLEARADPSKPYEARPEWYFMFMFQLLRYFDGPNEVVGTFVLPTLFFLVLFFWPLLDRTPQRDPRRRPVAMTLLSAATAGLVGLTIYAVATDVRMDTQLASANKEPPPFEKAGPIQLADVARIYSNNCASCHGVDGTGKLIRKGLPTIPDFTSTAWQQSQHELEITNQIQDGKEPLMPAYRDKLSEQQILALAIYVRAFSVPAPASKVEKPAPPTTTMTSAQVFQNYCLACHGADGRGEAARKAAMKSIPNFGDPAWQRSHAKDSELVHTILEGKKPFMAPMKDKLSQGDAQALVKLVRAFPQGKKVDIETVKPIIPTPPDRPKVVEGPSTKPKKKGPTTADAQLAARMRAATGLYRQYCMTCHGANGTGADMRAGMPQIPNFTSRVRQESLVDATMVASILNGKELMPAFAGRITEDQAKDLAAYLRAFGPPRARPKEGTAPASDFEKQFHKLQEEWDELEKQLKKLKNKR